MSKRERNGMEVVHHKYEKDFPRNRLRYVTEVSTVVESVLSELVVLDGAGRIAIRNTETTSKRFENFRALVGHVVMALGLHERINPSSSGYQTKKIA